MEGSHTLWCGGLDPATTAADLQELFGRVAPCTVALRRPQRQPSASGGPRLFAYVSYATAEQAATAQQQLDRRRLHGRSLRVMPRLWQPEGAARGVRALGVRLELQGLAPPIGSHQLQELGATFGRVLSASVTVDERGLSTGAGACVFEAAEAAEAALASWQGECALGPAVTARLAPQPQLAAVPQPPFQQAQQAQQQQQGPSMSSRRNRPKPAVVVRGLAPTTTAEQLQSVFSAAGEIRRLRLVADEGGQSAGVAFITFHDMDSVRAAVALGEGLVVDGRQPTVQPAHRELELEGEGEEGDRTQRAQRALPPLRGPGGAAAGGDAPPPRLRDSPLQRSRTSGLSFSASHLPGVEAAGALTAAAMHRAGSSPALSGLAGPRSPLSPSPMFGAATGAGAGAAPGEQSTDTLFVRPLGADADEAALRHMFAALPGLTFVRVLRHADGTSKGCGFVRFGEQAQAQHALQALDGASHGGRQLRVTWAHHRTASQRASWDHGAAGAGAGAGPAAPMSFGPSTSADLVPSAGSIPAGPQPFYDAASGVPGLPASPGYPASGVVMQTYWLPLQTYALPPGSPISPMAPPLAAPPYPMPPPLAMFGVGAGLPAVPAAAAASPLASPRRGGQGWVQQAAAQQRWQQTQQQQQQWQQAQQAQAQQQQQQWQQQQWRQQRQQQQQWQQQQQQLQAAAAAAAASWQPRPRSAPPSPHEPPLLQAQQAQPPSPTFFWGGSSSGGARSGAPGAQASQGGGMPAPASGSPAAGASQGASPTADSASASGSSLSLALRNSSRSGSSGATPSAEAGASQHTFAGGQEAGGGPHPAGAPPAMEQLAPPSPGGRSDSGSPPSGGSDDSASSSSHGSPPASVMRGMHLDDS